MGLSFLRGLVASVNPCAFVLLPTYLMYFLGLEGQLPGTQRATIRRALVVSAAVSAGFMLVFVSVGMMSEYVTDGLERNAKYATPVIGGLFVVMGIAMFQGYRLPIRTPHIEPGAPRRSLVAMFLYGIAYAVASISCTLPLFSTTLFGNVSQDGWWSGVANVAAYGAGMALMVTALTVTLALANTQLLGLMRHGSQYVEKISAMLVVLSGAYLIYYYWVVDLNEETSPVTDRVERFQRAIQTRLNDRWEITASVLAAVVVVAVIYAIGKQRQGDDVDGVDAGVPHPESTRNS